MVQLCQTKCIKVLSYGSVGGGLLSDKYVETLYADNNLNAFGRCTFIYHNLLCTG